MISGSGNVAQYAAEKFWIWGQVLACPIRREPFMTFMELQKEARTHQAYEEWLSVAHLNV